MKIPLALAAIGLTLLSGCAIRQTVKPMERFAGNQVCIVENPKVKNGFLDVYTRTLRNKGYAVRKLEHDASLVECPVTSTYTANWRWDMAMYMSFADITVYHNAKPVGKASYDATKGGANMGKFVDADKKITELVDQLFPNTAGS